jgi:hypothetical protein
MSVFCLGDPHRPHVDHDPTAAADGSGLLGGYAAHCPRCGHTGPVHTDHVDAALDRDRHGCEATQT